MTHDLSRLLRPRAIAVVGGGTWCANVIDRCRDAGFDGPVHPVHPARAEVAGLPAFPAPEALPEVPDAVFIGVNREATVDTVRRLAAMGAGGAVCFASGFEEARAEAGDGARLQAALLEAAGTMPIIGPNCYGVINYLDGVPLWPDQHGGARVASGVAVLTQSSNMAITLTMQARGVPLAYVVTAGNQAQLGLSGIGRALLEDTRVSALGLHVEGVGDLRAFEALAARARELGKPVVVLKAGDSEQARAAAVSHTASVAGTGAGARALFDRLGIARVDSLPALLEALKVLHLAGPLASGRIASMSCSGGEASLVADAVLRRNLVLPPLDTGQRAALRAALGPMVALANPLDYHTFVWGDVEAMARTFAAMLSGDVSLGCVIADFPRVDRCDPADWDCVITAGARAAAKAGKPLAVVATLPETMPEWLAHRIIAAGLVPLAGMDEALTAIEAAAFIGRDRPVPLPLVVPGDGGAARLWSEPEAKRVLAGYGIKVPRAAAAATPAEASARAAEIGFPCVLKGTGAAHKTEAGLVALGLADGATVAAAAEGMDCGAFLIEEMIWDGVAELLIGVTHDPAHGFVLTLGAGGTLTEILDDSVSLLLPVRAPEVAAALAGLRIAPLLAGHRGKPAACRDSIVAAVMALQAFVTAHAGPLEEVEINPLICTPDRAVAADALIRTGEET